MFTVSNSRHRGSVSDIRVPVFIMATNVTEKIISLGVLRGLIFWLPFSSLDAAALGR